MSTITPISGWMLDTVVEHDEYHPGFAGHYMRASDERRQAIAAFFSTGGSPQGLENTVGGYLAQANHRSILTRAFGHVPLGFRRALGKSGAQPHDPRYYADLYHSLAHGLSHVVTAVMHATRLDPERLEIIRMLPVDLCDSRIVERIKDLQHARDLIVVADLFEKRAGNRQGLVEALLSSRASLEATVRRWCRQLEYVDQPIEECAVYRPIRNGVELHEMARKYQNCGRNYTASTLTGESAFGEFIALDDRRVLLCFEKSEGSWTLDGVYVRRNRRVPADLDEQARDFVRMHDIPDRWEVRHSDDDVAGALGRLIRPHSEW